MSLSAFSLLVVFDIIVETNMSSSDSDADNGYYKKWSKMVDSKLIKEKNLSLSLSRKRKLETQAGQYQIPPIPPVTPLLVSHLEPAKTETGEDLLHLFPPVTPSFDHLQQGLQTSTNPVSTSSDISTEYPSQSLEELVDYSDVTVSPSSSTSLCGHPLPAVVHHLDGDNDDDNGNDDNDNDDNDDNDNDNNNNDNDNNNNNDNGISTYGSFEELDKSVKRLEIESVTGFNIKTNSQGFDLDTDLQTYLSTIKSVKDINLFWHNTGKNDNTPIKFNGTPFVILNKRLYTCHQGKDRNKNRNDKRRAKRQEMVFKEGLSDHCVTKSKKHIQPSKKLNCPA